MQRNDVNAAAVNRNEAAYFGVPWEDASGYAQAIKVGDAIYVSSQLSHDEKGNLIAPASLDESGQAGRVLDDATADAGDLRQCRQAFGALRGTLDNVADDTLYVLDVDSAFAVLDKVRKEPTAPRALSAPAI
jgi:enamine deaminase RidA (YjgF/YER057c/UK114 family)